MEVEVHGRRRRCGCMIRLLSPLHVLAACVLIMVGGGDVEMHAERGDGVRCSSAAGGDDGSCFALCTCHHSSLCVIEGSAALLAAYQWRCALHTVGACVS